MLGPSIAGHGGRSRTDSVALNSTCIFHLAQNETEGVMINLANLS